jgi:FkbM family methyltransferase
MRLASRHLALLRWRLLQRRAAGRRLLRSLAKAYDDPFFIEIGAGDGVKGDHLRPYVVSRGWRGIMVEPVPRVFERLRRNYAGNDRVTVENMAIADRDGKIPFYHFHEVGEQELALLPDNYELLGTFSRELLLRHEHIPDHERRIVATDVPCMSFESLCRKHRVDDLDVVVIDVEGYDYEIIKQINFDAYRPRVVVYEDIHLSDEDRAECRRTLELLGYEGLEEGFDTWLVDVRPDDRVTDTWRRILESGPPIRREDLTGWFEAIAGKQ